MTQAADNSTKVDASVMWQQLSERVDAFVSAWQQAASPPSLAEFLPEGPPAFRRLSLVEAIKVDLEYRWQERRWPKTVEEYLREFPELGGEGGLPCDIIYEEFHVRKRQGDAVSIKEYRARFPAREEELQRLFQLETAAQSTAMFPTERVPVFEAGQKIDDFDLVSPLGKGAFATVFLARQISMQRMVALKISSDRGFEPQTLAQLEHPNIVRVFDQRQLPQYKIRLLYMQYVPGGTLLGVIKHVRKVPPGSRSGATLLEAIDQALAANGEQPPTDSMTRYHLRGASWSQAVCWLGARLASALAYAHGRGVLHRDVKPANVLVGADGHPRLADFNISFSKLDGATPAAYFGGSLAYMSPEQLEAFDPANARQPADLDGRSDVYALGVLLWELLTAKRPFRDESSPESWSQSLGAMTAARRKGVPRESREFAQAQCPRAVIEVLLKCLEPDPQKRYPSADVLARELDLCLQPHAHSLLRGGTSWSSIFKRHPVLSTISIGLLPNIVMCIINILYNQREIMRGLSADDLRVFYSLIATVNAVAYSLGLGYVFVSRGKLFRALDRLAHGKPVEPPPSELLVRRCLSFGAAVAVITAALWTVSGFVIPTWIEFGAGSSSRISAEHYVHFLVSNLLCGLIAATQSYYVVTFFSVRYCYPWLFEARGPQARDVPALAETGRRSRIFLGLTFSVPFLALLALSALTPVEFRAVMFALGGIGLVGCALAYLLDLAIRNDLSALAGAANPSGDPQFGDDTMESFLSGSRRQGSR